MYSIPCAKSFIKYDFFSIKRKYLLVNFVLSKIPRKFYSFGSWKYRYKRIVWNVTRTQNDQNSTQHSIYVNWQKKTIIDGTLCKKNQSQLLMVFSLLSLWSWAQVEPQFPSFATSLNQSWSSVNWIWSQKQTVNKQRKHLCGSHFAKRAW